MHETVDSRAKKDDITIADVKEFFLLFLLLSQHTTMFGAAVLSCLARTEWIGTGFEGIMCNHPSFGPFSDAITFEIHEYRSFVLASFSSLMCNSFALMIFAAHSLFPHSPCSAPHIFSAIPFSFSPRLLAESLLFLFYFFFASYYKRFGTLSEGTFKWKRKRLSKKKRLICRSKCEGDPIWFGQKCICHMHCMMCRKWKWILQKYFCS